MQENFEYIIDPETNREVPVDSAVGNQVVKNYLECLKNGPDSENIISTKMFYQPPKKKKGGRRMAPVYEDESMDESKDELSVEEIYEGAKHLPIEQYDLEEVYDKYKHQEPWSPRKGKNVWIRRSNGKWQMALISEINQTIKGNLFDVFINAGNEKVGTKKGLSTSKALQVV